MDLPEPLAGRSAPDVLVFLRTATDDEIRAQVHAMGTPQALGLLFDGMAARFPADGGRRPGSLAFVLGDGEEQHAHVLHLTAEGAVHRAGAVSSARATLSTDLVGFLRVAAGAADPTRLFLTGRLRLAGDVLWAVRLLAGIGR